MSRSEDIRSSYKTLGMVGTLYDGVVSYSTFPGKILNRIMWGFNQQTNDQWLNGALAGIPDGFSGKLLEVPVGTGVLTMPLYRTLPEAAITCLDYSADMMKHARKKAVALGVENIDFIQGDVGFLPFSEESFDIVLSLNGFHAFPDKEKAFSETFRVLKKGGIFCGCFYVQGGFRRTDWFVKYLLEPKRAFTAPFETAETLKKRLEKMYAEVSLSTSNAEAYFVCKK